MVCPRPGPTVVFEARRWVLLLAWRLGEQNRKAGMFGEVLCPIAREDSNRSRERIGGEAEEIGAGLLSVIEDAFAGSPSLTM